MGDLDAAWEEFMSSGTIDNFAQQEDNRITKINNGAPEPSNIYISTKTRIIFLNNPVDLYQIFWKIDIIPYDKEDSGVIKKQIKIISNSEDELNELQNKLSVYPYHVEHVISHLDKQHGKSNVYKDVRKLSIGICHKDLLSFRSKQKSAFYNCFVIIIRLLDSDSDEFKEVHAKIFNTGKVEIPGIKSEKMFTQTVEFIIQLMNQYNKQINYDIMADKTETILINSNFHCGFCINRQRLFDLLRSKYNLNVSYDPCSYPGIQCKYNIDGFQISFMIFRTGSILIVGKCEEFVIHNVYVKLKEILREEYSEIYENYDVPVRSKAKNSKPRRKIIYI